VLVHGAPALDIRDVPKLTLYGKPGCHLCDDARKAVERVREQREFELEEVDVSADPRLHRKYGERIPVLELDGEPVFELFVDPDGLRRRLDKVAP
jgi:glutaredoxin